MYVLSLLNTRNARTTQNPVGAGLPAIRVCHSTVMSTDPTPSRASPLPQGFVRAHLLLRHKKRPEGRFVLNPVRRPGLPSTPDYPAPDSQPVHPA